MSCIERIDLSDSSWYLLDSLSEAKYRERPFENYSELPYYKHEIEAYALLFVFSLERKESGAYDIGSFGARPLDSQSGWLRWSKLQEAFDQAVPLLKMFLSYRCEIEFENSSLNLTNSVTIKSFVEEQSEAIELHLSGGAYSGIEDAKMLFEAFDVDSIEGIRIEAQRQIAQKIQLPKEAKTTLWFDFYEEWLEADREEEFKEDLENLAKYWFVPNASVESIYAEIYARYLSRKQPLPIRELYVAKNLEFLRPYFKCEE